MGQKNRPTHPPADADSATVLARAEAAVAALAEEYLLCVRDDLSTLQACLAVLRDSTTCDETRAAVARRMFATAHDMKGQAATFGYPLLTRIAQALCRLLDGDQAPTEGSLDQIALLIAGMETVMDRQLKGDGGHEGQDLLQRIDVRPG